MKTLGNVRALAASLSVLAMGAVAVSPAMAFDNLEWNWKNGVDQHTDVDVNIDVDLKSTGLVQIEKLQIFLGDLKATSYVDNIINTPAGAPTNDLLSADCKDHDNCDGGGNTVPSLYAPTELPIVLSSATAVGNNQSITTDTPVFLHDGQFVANVRGCDYGCDGYFDTAAFSA